MLPGVAPRAGAWIETCTGRFPALSPGRSPLAQGRGLKPELIIHPIIHPFVAPRAGAWIETGRFFLQSLLNPRSPLAQGRGLKRYIQAAPVDR